MQIHDYNSEGSRWKIITCTEHYTSDILQVYHIMYILCDFESSPYKNPQSKLVKIS